MLPWLNVLSLLKPSPTFLKLNGFLAQLCLSNPAKSNLSVNFNGGNGYKGQIGVTPQALVAALRARRITLLSILLLKMPKLMLSGRENLYRLRLSGSLPPGVDSLKPSILGE